MSPFDATITEQASALVYPLQQIWTGEFNWIQTKHETRITCLL